MKLRRAAPEFFRRLFGKERERGPGPPPAAHLALGARGERLAADLLERAGYRLVAANFKLPVGRNLRGAVVQAEIDLVAYDGGTLCFVEVKTRRSDEFAAPEANVDLRKQRQITRARLPARLRFDLRAPPLRRGQPRHPRRERGRQRAAPARAVVPRLLDGGEIPQAPLALKSCQT
jgi:Holliday junction resolvase-like predicted endonuclease